MLTKLVENSLSLLSEFFVQDSNSALIPGFLYSGCFNRESPVPAEYLRLGRPTVSGLVCFAQLRQFCSRHPSDPANADWSLQGFVGRPSSTEIRRLDDGAGLPLGKSKKPSSNLCSLSRCEYIPDLLHLVDRQQLF